MFPFRGCLMVDRLVRLLCVVGMFATMLAVWGCGKKTPDYTPSLTSAEDAVRRCMDAWKAGHNAAEVPGTDPAICISDVGRKPGQRLESYRILGETRGSTGRTIAVTLNLVNPAEEVKARYIVVGINPLLVFRQEDYDLLMHWDHRMPEIPANTPNPGERATKPDDDEKPIEPLVVPEAPEQQRCCLSEVNTRL